MTSTPRLASWRPTKPARASVSVNRNRLTLPTMAAGRVEAERTQAKHANGAQTARKAGYDEGYQQGKTDGEREGFGRGKAAAPADWSGAQLDQHRIRQLLNLCHPDKHGNSPASNTVTQWLNGVLKEMRG